MIPLYSLLISLRVLLNPCRISFLASGLTRTQVIFILLLDLLHNYFVVHLRVLEKIHIRIYTENFCYLIRMSDRDRKQIFKIPHCTIIYFCKRFHELHSQGAMKIYFPYSLLPTPYFQDRSIIANYLFARIIV